MTIWFYFRDAQVGDLVYADGSMSDRINKSKTIVGVCFYIDPVNKTRRLCISGRGLENNLWGLYAGSWSNGIKLKDKPDYDVFGVPTLPTKSTGFSNIDGIDYRNGLSETDADGFTIFSPNLLIGEIGWTESDVDYKDMHRGDMLPWGKLNTMKIIIHRNNILLDSDINLPLPSKDGNISEFDSLIQLMQQTASNNGNNNSYKQYYYPAASFCHSYEPVFQEGEMVSDSFKAGNWYLPSSGELARLYWWNTHNIHHEKTENGVLKKFIADGVFEELSMNVFWSSDKYESSNGYAYVLNMAAGNAGSYPNASNFVVRPVCAF